MSSGGVLELHRSAAPPTALQLKLESAFKRAPGPAHPVFTKLQYRNAFRPSQQQVLKLASDWQGKGRHQWHIVAPPGSGKTILGLELIRRLGRPALVLSPNTAIQVQWVDKCAHFVPPGCGLEVPVVASGEPAELRPVTALTYQSLTTAGSHDELMEHAAVQLWIEDIVAGRGISAEEAADRLQRMHEANAAEYRHEMAAYKGKLRERMVADPQFDLMKLLHPHARSLIDRLCSFDIGTLVLDECHHLTGFWALVVGEVAARLAAPVIIGLTATPPMDHDDRELLRYLDVVGEIGYQVPTPAVVKEGHLAPYQDLVFLTRPLPREEHFIATQHEAFQALARKLLERDSAFLQWVSSRVTTPWTPFYNAHPGLAAAAVKLLRSQNAAVPADVPTSPSLKGPMALTDWAFLLEDYTLNSLKLSARPEDQTLYEEIRTASRALGLLLTETGFREYVSPVDRVLALSASKLDALTTILAAESRSLGPALRALVLTDYEKTSATATHAIEGVLDAEAGGAVAAFGALLAVPETNALDPMLITGSTLLCDADNVSRFLDRARAWLQEHKVQAALTSVPVEGRPMHEIQGTGSDWSTRTAIQLVTTVFEEGLTSCLVGTRALLGEGWDAVSLNTLVDLTAVTAFMTVNQLRGRSLRVDPKNPRKVANNWDVVCIAPRFEKGFNDYQRFVHKHEGFHGLCDDGQIASGTGHVHPAFTRTAPQQLDGMLDGINRSMLERAAQRDRVYTAWRIGEPYRGVEVATLEVALQGDFGERPVAHRPGLLAAIEQVFSVQGHSRTTQEALKSIADCVLFSLIDTKRVRPSFKGNDIALTLRSDGFYRVYLNGASPEEAELFASSVLEVLSPLQDQRYLIPRYEADRPHGMFERVVEALAGSNSPGRLAMWHPVPDALATSKETVKVFADYWNRWVSPGEPVFARRPEGQQLLSQFRDRNLLGVQGIQRTVWQ